jgi:hypothetical protein
MPAAGVASGRCEFEGRSQPQGRALGRLNAREMSAAESQCTHFRALCLPSRRPPPPVSAPCPRVPVSPASPVCLSLPLTVPVSPCPRVSVPP